LINLLFDILFLGWQRRPSRCKKKWQRPSNRYCELRRWILPWQLTRSVY